MVPAALFLSPELSACDPREAVSPYGRPSARGSDFFGPHALQSTVGDRVFARALGGRPAHVLGDPDVPHTVTYIDDFGKALVNLGEREDALGGVWHVPNAGTVTMRRFVELVFAEVGRPPRLRAAPSWGLVLAGLFNPTLRAVREQLYQSERACWSTAASLNGPSAGKRPPFPRPSGRRRPGSGSSRDTSLSQGGSCPTHVIRRHSTT